MFVPLLAIALQTLQGQVQATSATNPTPPSVSAAHEKDIQSDDKLGAEYSKEVAKEMKFATDPAEQARVDRIGNYLAGIADSHQLVPLWGDPRFSPFHYTFHVVKGNDVNAFSLPGGYVYVYEGLLKEVQSDDELAGVLAHEISHAAFRHVAWLQKEESKMSLLTLPLVLIGIMSSGGSGGEAILLGQLVNQATGSGWSQKAEFAADNGSFQILCLSKYNPVGLLTFLERMEIQDKEGPQIAWGIFRTHPPSQERVQKVLEDLDQAHIPVRRSEVSTTFSCEVKPGDNGEVGVWYGHMRICGFKGSDAITNADNTEKRINTYLDSTPQAFETTIGPDGNIYGRGIVLVYSNQLSPLTSDQKPAETVQTALDGIKHAIASYNYFVQLAGG